MSKQIIKTYEQFTASLINQNLVKENIDEIAPISVTSLPENVAEAMMQLFEQQHEILEYDTWFDQMSKSFYNEKKMLEGYLVAALWTEEERLKEYNPDLNLQINDFESASILKAKNTIRQYMQYGKFVLNNPGSSHDEDTMGHELWLTSNGHGAGISDGQYSPAEETILRYAIKDIKGFDLMDTDEGRLFFM